MESGAGKVSRFVQGRLKRQRTRRQAVFLAAVSVMVILPTVVVFLTTAPPDGTEEKADTGSAVLEEEVSAGEQPFVAGSLTLGVGGDVTFGLEVADFIQAHGPGYPWTEISPLLQDYRFTVVNLEGPLCRAGRSHPHQTSYPIRGNIACAEPMAEAGVDAVCLANDHAMDYGYQGLEETLNVLHAAGISTAGAGPSLRVAEQPTVLQDGEGNDVALLSFSDVGPSSCAAGENRAGIATADASRLEEAVRKADAEHSYVVVFLHWGDIGSSEVTARQKELALVCVRAGADLVVGSHPHVVQEMELVEGVPVFYSLGNLVFFSRGEGGKRGIFLGCRFEAGDLTEVRVIPILIEEGKPSTMPGDRAVEFLRGWSERCAGVDLEMSSAGSGNAFLRWTPGS